MYVKEKAILLLTFVALVLSGLLLLRMVPAQAEPYIAVRAGYKCSTCHVNRTGGGMRTDFGLVYSQTTLPMTVLRSPEGSGLFDNRLSESVSIGANLRVAELFRFEHTNSQGETFPSTNTTDFTEANVYIKVEAIPEVVTFYADQTLTPTSSNRELFGLVTYDKHSTWVKVGRMLLPYGLRLIDNDAFIRSRVGYTYRRSATGLEVGWQPRSYTVILNLVDDNFSAVASYVRRRFRIGGSFGRNTTKSNDNAIGPFAGVNFGRFTLLGEVDWINKGGTDQLAALAELNYLMTRGFNFKFTYEFFDRNRDVSNSNDGQERYTIGVEPFVAQFVQLRAFYRFNEFIPQNGPENQDQAILEFQLFF